MATKVFISWSGDLSNKLAEAVRQWLPGVLQFVKPYFTPSDIEKGARWGTDIVSELGSSDIGIIFLTKENLNKPWILFESGALSKNFEKSKVCTLLFDVETTDLTGPLTIFQNTRFNKEDFKKLVKTINSTGGDAKLEPAVLDDVFEMWWPKLDQQVNGILEEQQHAGEGDQRSDRDILEEVLALTRLSSRGSPREMDYPPIAVVELAETFGDLANALRHRNPRLALELCERLERPISHIVRRTDAPELWDHWVSIRRRTLPPSEPEDEGESDAKTLHTPL